ncbi:MAG: dienelactone hydrolase [Pirellulales bacterium]
MMLKTVCLSVLLISSLLRFTNLSYGQQSNYDPTSVDKSIKVETLEFDIEYQAQGQARMLRRAESSNQIRKVPIKIYLPTGSKSNSPVVLFSHGLGGSREGFKHGGEHWARRGFVAVFLQHPGSDESVWRGAALGQRRAAMTEAASGQNLISRIDDVKATIDWLESIQNKHAANTSKAKLVQTEANWIKPLASQMDLHHIGMSGHSFGAITTQMVSGQSPVIASQQPTDSRIKAAVVLSPSAPKLGQPERFFSKVSIPWMLMTGTKDDSPIGDQSAESRLAVFPALPAGSKYQVVFDGGTHAFLGERAGVTTQSAEQSSHAQATVVLATAFWDAYLRGDEAAKKWLDGEGPRKVLSAKDQWEKK